LGVEGKPVKSAVVVVSDQSHRIVSSPKRASDREEDRRGSDWAEPRELWVTVGGAGSGHVEEIIRIVRVAAVGTHDWFPAAVEARLDQVHFVVDVRSVLGVPEVAGQRIESETEAVANAVGKIACDGADAALASGTPCSCGARLTCRRAAVRNERIARCGRAVLQDAKDHRRIVRRGAGGEVLQLIVPVEVADDRVQDTSVPDDSTCFRRQSRRGSRTEKKNAAVMIGSRRDGKIENQLFVFKKAAVRVPRVPIDTIPERSSTVGLAVAVGIRHLRVVKKHARRALRVDRDSQEPALARIVHRHIEHGRGLQRSVHHAAHSAVVLLQDEKVAGPEKGHRGR
jgi:hypothetical protein